MGYLTNYSLTLHNATEDQEAKVLNLLNAKEIIGYALTDDFNAYDSVKWYDHKKDMIEISIAVPDVLFELHGEGEETGDIWDHYFKNGKAQLCKAKIVIPPFDENQMK